MVTDEERRARRAEYMRVWRTENPKAWQKIAAKARAKWKDENPEAHRVAQRNHRTQVRVEILALIGCGVAKCKRCGCDDVRCLQVDHINGGGKQDPRTKQGVTSLWQLRDWVRENLKEARAMYQVLCANCNWIKRHENGEWHPVVRSTKL